VPTAGRGGVWLGARARGVGAAAAAADPVTPPRGSTPDEHGAWRSSRSFRDTVEHVTKQLRRQGIDADVVGPYRRRDTLVVRWVVPSGRPFRAVHVWQRGGRTWFAVVPPEARTDGTP
jgi:hypothetical protein